MGPTAGEPTTTISVAIVEDHELVRDGLRALIDATPGMTVAGEADTADRADAMIERTRPDVALVDIHLPDRTGIEVCRAAKDLDPPVRCLILTSLAHDEALFEAVLAGASGYVLKQIRSKDLVTCIQQVARGETLVDQRSAAAIRERATSPDADPMLAALSDQERRLVDLLAQGMTNREIAEEMFLAEQTVKNYVSTLLGKLGMARRSEAAALGARVAERRRLADPPPQSGPILY